MAATEGYLKLNYNATSTEIKIQIEKGLDRPERYSMYPPIVNEIVDGSKNTQFKGYIRKARIVTVPLTDEQIEAYLSWMLDNDRTIDYNFNGQSEEDLVLIPSPDQELIWNEDCSLMPYLDIDLTEGSVTTVGMA